MVIFTNRAVYKYRRGEGSTKGYVEWSLSYFNVADFKDNEKPENATLNGIPAQSYCRYVLI